MGCHLPFQVSTAAPCGCVTKEVTKGDGAQGREFCLVHPGCGQGLGSREGETRMRFGKSGTCEDPFTVW